MVAKLRFRLAMISYAYKYDVITVGCNVESFLCVIYEKEVKCSEHACKTRYHCYPSQYNSPPNKTIC